MTALQAIATSKTEERTVRVRCATRGSELFRSLEAAVEAGQGSHAHDGEGGHVFEGFDWKVICDVGADWRAVHGGEA